MDEATLVTRSDEMIEGEVDGELVGLHIERGLYLGFNATATELWRRLETPQTLAALVDGFTASHRVDRATCADDLAAALVAMRDAGLVTLAPA